MVRQLNEPNQTKDVQEALQEANTLRLQPGAKRYAFVNDLATKHPKQDSMLIRH